MSRWWLGPFFFLVLFAIVVGYMSHGVEYGKNDPFITMGTVKNWKKHNLRY